MKKNKHHVFQKEKLKRIQQNAQNPDLVRAASQFMHASTIPKYSYNFAWMGRPIIQYPQDMAAMQEIIWKVRPDLIIETGIAHGGSLIFSASILALLDLCEGLQKKQRPSRKILPRKVLGIDIDIRRHNREAIQRHPMASRIRMIQGSSIAPAIVAKVKAFAKKYSRILVCLDSNHTHEHVLAELNAFAPLVSKNSYCVIFDTIIDNLPKKMFPDRPWGPLDNPKTAVRTFLKTHPEFKVDQEIDQKLLISVAPEGYLKRVR